MVLVVRGHLIFISDQKFSHERILINLEEKKGKKEGGEEKKDFFLMPNRPTGFLCVDEVAGEGRGGREMGGWRQARLVSQIVIE